MHIASFKIEVSKVQDFGNCELSPLSVLFDMGLEAIKPVYRVCDQVRFSPVCSATQTGRTFYILQIAGGGIKLTKALIRLCRFACVYMQAEITLCNNNYIGKQYIVKPVLSGYPKIDKTKILMTNGSLMKVESIVKCSPWSILQCV